MVSDDLVQKSVSASMQQWVFILKMKRWFSFKELSRDVRRATEENASLHLGVEDD